MSIYNTLPFEECYIPVTESGCWLWLGKYATEHPTLGAYGSYKSDSAHRYSYKLYKGPIPKGMYVCHTCDVRECVNPDHLFLGSPTHNHRDMILKGRVSKLPIKKCLTFEEAMELQKINYTKLPPDQQPYWYRITREQQRQNAYQDWRRAHWGELRGMKYTPPAEDL